MANGGLTGGARRAGFTLIEVVIVVSIIAIIAAIAIPNLLSGKISANEAFAIQTMKNLVGAQETFRSQRIVDQDGDGQGEYGFLAELAGSVVPRGAPGALRPAVLSSTLSTWDGSMVLAVATARKASYIFQMWLPDAVLGAVDEETALAGAGPTTAGASVAANADLQETNWCAYCWPQVRGGSGRQTLFINQQGDILATRGNDALGQYGESGTPVRPAFDAAFVAAGSILGEIAVNAVGSDGNAWSLVK